MDNNIYADYSGWEAGKDYPEWFDSLSAGKQHTDFFANRVTNYSKGVQNWDAADIF